jgi:hypothetical protein
MASVSFGLGEYHLERESIIWMGRVSSGWGEYHLDGESVIWIERICMDVYHLDMEGII